MYPVSLLSAAVFSPSSQTFPFCNLFAEEPVFSRSMTLEDARRQFPHTWTDKIYLNHAAISPLPFVVRDAMDKYFERRALKGIESYPWANTIALETKKLLADILHTKAERIAFSLNTAEGVSILASGLEWQQDDRILL